MSDLKPCPFCGGPADAGYFPGDYDIGCNTCLISVSRHASDFDGDIEAAKAEAVAAWNTRDDMIPRAEAEAMVAEAVAKERERCARLADPPLAHRKGKPGLWRQRRTAIAAAIRQTEGEW